MKNRVTIELYVDDKGTVHVKKFAGETEKSFKKMEQQAKTSTTGMGSALQKLKSHWMAVTAATAGTIIAIGKVLKKFATWEVSLVDMKKVTSESLASIKAKIMGLHPALGTSIELVKGYYQVISAGVKHPVKAMSLLVTASKAAKAAHVAQSEVIKGLTKIMAGYEGEIKNVSDAADLLFAIEKEGQTTVAELIPLIGGLAKISHDLGISQDEMGASLALVTQTAGSTAEAATQYQGVLMALLKPTDTMKKMIKAMGFESAEAAIKQLGLAETLKRLKAATGGSSEKIAEMFGNVEGLKGMSALGAKGFVILADKVDVVGKKTGLASTAWKDYKKTSTSAWDALKASIEKVTIAVGESGLAGAAKKAAYWLSDAAEYWTKLFKGPQVGIDIAKEMLEGWRKELKESQEDLLHYTRILETPGMSAWIPGYLDKVRAWREETIKNIAMVEAKIAFVTQPRAQEPELPPVPGIPPPGAPPPAPAPEIDWKAYMDAKKAEFALLKKEQQSAHDFALLLAKDEMDERIKLIEFEEEINAMLLEIKAQYYLDDAALAEKRLIKDIEISNQKIALEKETEEIKRKEAFKTHLEMISYQKEAFAELAKGSEMAFAMYKVFSVAETVMKTYEAAQNAYAWASGWGGPLAGAAAAAVATAAGMARVAAIRNLEPAAMYHEGGIVGRGSRPSRMVSPDVFAGAQRAHTGLAPDERPVIVRKDEGIFTPAQMAALGMGEGEGSIMIHNHLYIDGREVTKDQIHILETDGVLLGRFRRALS